MGMRENLIETDWLKCDKKDCNKVAWLRLSYPELGVSVNMCETHYLKEREITRNWEVSNIDY